MKKLIKEIVKEILQSNIDLRTSYVVLFNSGGGMQPQEETPEDEWDDLFDDGQWPWSYHLNKRKIDFGLFNIDGHKFFVFPSEKDAKRAKIFFQNEYTQIEYSYGPAYNYLGKGNYRDYDAMAKNMLKLFLDKYKNKRLNPPR